MRKPDASIARAELSRRQFLLGSMATGVLGAAGGLPGIVRQARAMTPTLNRNILGNLFLNGGPDHRHLFMPAYESAAASYGRQFWEARARSQLRGTGTGTSLQDRYDDAYLPREDERSGIRFGIFGGAQWLADMYDQGHVAIVSNVFSDDSRDHENAIRSMELGNRNAVKLTRGSGWGGRVAHAAGGRSVALTQSIRTFALGPDPADPTNVFRWSDADVVPAPNMRDLKPYYPAPDDWLGSGQMVARSLHSYYEAKRSELPANSPYTRFLDQERKLREFGDLIESRLVGEAHPEPLRILGKSSEGYEGPVDYGLGQQMRNLYDSVLCYDLLDMRVASMEYNGWDTHDNQGEEIEGKLSALYGRGQALETFWSALSGKLGADERKRLTLVICGEFGRQTNDNGGNGTDHGTGNDIILIGENVRGGIYGDKFPDSDFPKFGVEGADTDGLTAIDHLFGRLSDWVVPNSASTVFPDIASAPKEAGLDLGRLLG